jgi:hypothetical protein
VLKRSSISVVLCFFVFLIIYGATSRADLQLSDEFAVFVSGISLATRGSLDIDELRFLQEREHLGHEGVDGHLYTKYFPGNVLGTALIYRLTQRADDVPYLSLAYALTPDPHIFAPSNLGARLALRLNSLLGALGVAALYAVLLRRFDWKTAAITALLFGLCTDWWYQARGLFSETGAGALLILSLALAEARSPGWSGLSLGLSLLFRPTNLLGIPIWLYGVWEKGLKSLWTGIFIAMGFCALLAYNWIRFHSVLDFGYANEQFSGWIVEGLVGVFFSPGRSLFFYSPLLILCISGGISLYKSDRVFTGALLMVIAGYILTTAMWHTWDGGTSWGSRLLTPVLPLLGVLLAPMVEKALSITPERSRFYIVLLAVLGLGIQLLTLSANAMYVLIYYTTVASIPYGDTINSFQNSWLSLQIRYLEHWNICNIDSYSLKQLFIQCR